MNGNGRRVEFVLPMRTILLVAASVAVLAALRAIGDSFLVVFIGIFLGLVFEYPRRRQHSDLRRDRPGRACSV